MQCKVTNTFTVKCGDSVAVVHNEVLDIFSAVVNGNRYSKFIAVGSGSGRNGDKLASLLAVKETVRAEYNGNTDHGDIFAVYSVRLNGEDIADGQTISELALTPSREGDNIANYAVLPTPVTKVSGEDIYIYARVHISFSLIMSGLILGENAFLNVLLGLEELDTAQLEVGYGNNFHPNVSTRHDGTLITAKSAATVTKTEDGMRISSARYKISPYELLLLYKGKVVMRSYYTQSAVNKSASVALRRDHTFELLNKHVVDVTAVKAAGVPVMDVYVAPLLKFMTQSCADIFPYKLKKNATVTTDVAGGYLAVKTDVDISVYKLVDFKALSMYKVLTTQSVFTLAPDGSLFLGGDNLELAMLAGGDVVALTVGNYTSVSKVVAVAYNGLYYVAMLTEGNFVMISYDGETVTEIVRVNAVPSDFDFSAYSPFIINYWSVSGDIYGNNGPVGSVASVSTRQKTALTKTGRTLYKVCGKWIYCYDSNGNSYSLTIPDYPTSFPIASGHEVDILGENAITWKNGKLTGVFSYYANNLMPMRLTNSNKMPLERGTSCAIFNNYLLITYADGSVQTAYLAPYGAIVHCPTVDVGKTVSYESIQLADPRQSANQYVSISFDFTSGG